MRVLAGNASQVLLVPAVVDGVHGELPVQQSLSVRLLDLGPRTAFVRVRSAALAGLPEHVVVQLDNRLGPTPAVGRSAELKLTVTALTPTTARLGRQTGAALLTRVEEFADGADIPYRVTEGEPMELQVLVLAEVCADGSDDLPTTAAASRTQSRGDRETRMMVLHAMERLVEESAFRSSSEDGDLPMSKVLRIPELLSAIERAGLPWSVEDRGDWPSVAWLQEAVSSRAWGSDRYTTPAVVGAIAQGALAAQGPPLAALEAPARVLQWLGSAEALRQLLLARLEQSADLLSLASQSISGLLAAPAAGAGRGSLTITAGARSAESRLGGWKFRGRLAVGRSVRLVFPGQGGHGRPGSSTVVGSAFITGCRKEGGRLVIRAKVPNRDAGALAVALARGGHGARTPVIMVQPPSAASFRLLLEAVSRGCLTETAAGGRGGALGGRVRAALFPAPDPAGLAGHGDRFGPFVDAVLDAGPCRGVHGERELTAAQRRAVAACLLRPRLHVIFGPPGTGKTTTLCELLQQVLHSPVRSRALVLTHSNAAVDLIVDRLLSGASGRPAPRGSIVRWSGVMRTKELVETQMGPEAAARILSVTAVDGEGQCKTPTVHALAAASVVAATVNKAAELVRALDSNGCPRFDFVIVDEASQPTEGELLAPLLGALNAGRNVLGQYTARALPGSAFEEALGSGVLGPGGLGCVGQPLLPGAELEPRVIDQRGHACAAKIGQAGAPTLVLAGDPRQLGPVVHDRLASLLGLGVSALERMLGPETVPEIELSTMAGGGGWLTGDEARADGPGGAVRRAPATALAAAQLWTALAAEGAAADGAAGADRSAVLYGSRSMTSAGGGPPANAAMAGMMLSDDAGAFAGAMQNCWGRAFAAAVDTPRLAGSPAAAVATATASIGTNAAGPSEASLRWVAGGVLAGGKDARVSYLSESFRAHGDITSIWSQLVYGGEVNAVRGHIDEASAARGAWAAAAVVAGMIEAPYRGTLLEATVAEHMAGRLEAPPSYGVARAVFESHPPMEAVVNAAVRRARHEREAMGELPFALPRVVVIAIDGFTEWEEGNPSPFNRTEAEVATSIVRRLIGGGKAAVRPQDIGLVSPYSKQAHTVHKMVQSALGDAAEGFRCGSVEQFQGDEVSVELISTTRAAEVRGGASLDGSHSLRAGVGFLANPRRTNVAISRARDLLVVVGDPSVLAADPHWGAVLAFSALMGGVVDCTRGHALATGGLGDLFRGPPGGGAAGGPGGPGGGPGGGGGRDHAVWAGHGTAGAARGEDVEVMPSLRRPVAPPPPPGATSVRRPAHAARAQRVRAPSASAASAAGAAASRASGSGPARAGVGQRGRAPAGAAAGRASGGGSQMTRAGQKGRAPAGAAASRARHSETRVEQTERSAEETRDAISSLLAELKRLTIAEEASAAPATRGASAHGVPDLKRWNAVGGSGSAKRQARAASLCDQIAEERARPVSAFAMGSDVYTTAEELADRTVSGVLDVWPSSQGALVNLLRVAGCAQHFRDDTEEHLVFLVRGHHTNESTRLVFLPSSSDASEPAGKAQTMLLELQKRKTMPESALKSLSEEVARQICCEPTPGAAWCVHTPTDGQHGLELMRRMSMSAATYFGRDLVWQVNGRSDPTCRTGSLSLSVMMAGGRMLD